MREVFNDYMDNKIKVDKVTLVAIYFFIIVFTGIFGFLYEFIFYFFNSGMKTFYWRGGNFLPWINIYAIGSLLILFLTRKYKKKKLNVFLISFFSCGILEYISGFIMERVQHGVRCWDYNREILNFLNIDGYVCLRSVLVFGLCGLLLVYVIVPMVYYLAKKINKKVFVSVCTILFILFISDELYNLFVANLLHLPRASSIYKKIGFNYLYFRGY